MVFPASRQEDKISLIFFILYWIMLIGGEELADRIKISPELAMWAPNVLILVIALWLNYRLILEREITLPGLFRKKCRAKNEKCKANGRR